MKVKSSKGFTLIELLVVIAIIAILSSVVLIGLAPARVSSRDSRRVQDLNQIRNALELYFNRCGYYPGPSLGSGACPVAGFGGTVPSSWAVFQTTLTGSNIGVTSVANDPISGRNYVYGVVTAAPAGCNATVGGSYILQATLEDTSGNNPVLASDIDTIPPCTYGWTQATAPSCVDPAGYCVGL